MTFTTRQNGRAAQVAICNIAKVSATLTSVSMEDTCKWRKTGLEPLGNLMKVGRSIRLSSANLITRCSSAVERGTENPRVGGANPSTGTISRTTQIRSQGETGWVVSPCAIDQGYVGSTPTVCTKTSRSCDRKALCLFAKQRPTPTGSPGSIPGGSATSTRKVNRAGVPGPLGKRLVGLLSHAFRLCNLPPLCQRQRESMCCAGL